MTHLPTFEKWLIIESIVLMDYGLLKALRIMMRMNAKRLHTVPKGLDYVAKKLVRDKFFLHHTDWYFKFRAKIQKCLKLVKSHVQSKQKCKGRCIWEWMKIWQFSIPCLSEEPILISFELLKRTGPWNCYHLLMLILIYESTKIDLKIGCWS